MVRKLYLLLQGATLSYTSEMSNFFDSLILGLAKKLFYSLDRLVIQKVIVILS